MPDSASTANPKRRYKAFVSYSHRDKAAGARLFKRIDGYRPPRQLRGRDTAKGPVPARFYPCFRDREELATVRDVRAELDAALEASDQLVVLCSPAAAQSRWVGHEIETFIRLGRADRIHAVLLEGEPDAAFPEALKTAGGAPLAADLRREGDGWADGPLKLAAGLLGLGFGELKDREVARARAQARLNAMIAAAFALLFVVATGGLWFALDRNDKLQDALIGILDQVTERVDRAADEQGKTMTTAEVEREIAFARTLTDTAFRLAPDSPKLLAEQARLLIVYSRHYRSVGKGPEAQAAAAEASAIYEKLGKNGGEDIQRDRMQMVANTDGGDALLAAGDVAGAKARYEAGLKVAEKLVALDPGNAQFQRDLSISFNKLGDLALRAGDVAEATARFEAGLKVREKLVALDPGNAQFQRDLSISFNNLGDLARRAGDVAGAKARFEAGLKVAEKLVALDPGNAQFERDLSLSVFRLADLADRSGNVVEAGAGFERYQKQIEKLVALDPGNAEFQNDLSISLERVGYVAERAGDVEEARAKYTAKLAIDEKLVRLDPANTKFQRDLSISFEKLGGLALRVGDVAGAKARFEAGLKVREKLVALDPGNAEFQRDLSISFNKLGDLALRAGDVAGAKARFEAGLKVREKLVALDPGNAEFQRDLSISFEKLGDLALRAGDVAGATARHEAGLKVREKLVALDPGNAQFQRDLYVSHFKLADLGGPDADTHWRAAYDVLKRLRDRGAMQADDEPFYRTLAARLGERVE